jgi:putative oxidoreductase
MHITIITFWALLIAFVAPCYAFGFKKLLGHPQSKTDFARWGYPLWFMRLLGLGEIVAATCMLFEPTRLAGICFFALIFAGAVATHIRSKDPVKLVMTPVFVGLHLLLVFAFTFWI